MILPVVLEDENISGEIIRIIKRALQNEGGKIPEDMLTGRLLLLTKTGGPVATIDQTRPISVQSLPTRIMEKTIKRQLEKCDK